jgi:glutathione synthase/RimK-type ligase-like ATP-grasp enzyme
VTRFVVVGNPDNRRVSLFRAAARAAGLTDPAVVAWRDVAAGAPVAIDEGSLVRVDSPGEDAEIDRLLRGADEPAAHGEIVGLAAWYRGFVAALRRLELAAHGSRLLGDPGEIAVLFDKRACHALLRSAGIPVPPALAPPRSYAHLESLMDDAGWSRVFVKPVHGSSASGVLALRRHRAQVRATTSVECEGGRLFNSLRVREYDSPSLIASIVDRLAPDGLHVERWFPKADLDGRATDLRVVVIAGQPSHVVVRTSRGPITNLHLGGARGSLDDVRSLAGGEYDRAMQTCARVAACFPGCLQVGVDLMFSSDWSRHAVAEVNAFGDLLPGLLVDGRDTYAAQIAAVANPVAT